MQELDCPNPKAIIGLQQNSKLGSAVGTAPEPNQEGQVSEVNLAQADADALLAMEKHRVDETEYDFPGVGGALRIPLQSPDKRESFHLDMTRSQIKLAKVTYQNRARSVVVLARLDLNGAPHRNPDDEEIECPHIHLYREGYGDRWAFPLPLDKFSGATDAWTLFQEFMAFVNISLAPNVRRGLFV